MRYDEFDDRSALRPWLLFVLGVGILILIGMFPAEGQQAEETTHVLPIANFGDYDTRIVLNNPTSERIEEPVCSFSPCAGIAPFETYSFYTTQLDGVQTFALDSRLDVYVEITDPFGQIVRVGDLGEPAGEAVQMQDLRTTGEFRTFLYIYAAETVENGIVVNAYRDAEILSSDLHFPAEGQTIIPSVTTGANRVVVEPGHPWLGVVSRFYALGLISHQPMGELLVVRSRPVE